MEIEARESIRIAEKFFPNDPTRQLELAKDIANAISACAAIVAHEVLEEALSKAARPN